MAKVLIFYQYFSTPAGRWGTRYYELGRRWAAQGHKVTVVTSIYDKSDLVTDGLLSHQRIAGIDLIVINVRLSNKHGLALRLLSFAAYALIACWYAATRRADVVIASSGPLTVVLPGLLARWLRRRTLLFEVRDLLPLAAIEMGLLRNRIARWSVLALERLAYCNASQVIALSSDMVAPIRRTCPSARITVLPNGADLDLYHPDKPIPSAIRNRVSDRMVLLYAGSLGAANAGDEFVDLAVELERRQADDVLLVIIGDGHERPHLEQRVKRLGLSTLLLLEPIPRSEVAAWHAAATLVLIGLKGYAALRASSPNKLFDAFAAGRPVINNTPGWIADLLSVHRCGLTHTPGDVAVACNHVLQLRDDPLLRARMGGNARRLAEDQFARDHLAARYAELFPAA